MSKWVLMTIVFISIIIIFGTFQESQSAPDTSIVKSFQKISDTTGNFFPTPLDDGDHFSHGLADIGDLDGDGVGDIAVGAEFDDDGCPLDNPSTFSTDESDCNKGAVYILFLNKDGTVKSHQKISDTEGGFDAKLDNKDRFGYQVTNIDDLDGDGIQDLAISAIFDDDGGLSKGAVYILFMKTDGTVKSHQKISNTKGGFTASLDKKDLFATDVTNLGDLDGDEVQDLAVSAMNDDDGCPVTKLNCNKGAIYILFLNKDGTVKSHQKISETEGGFGGDLEANDFFGHAISVVNDLNNDGITDLAVGANKDDDGGNGRGAIYILFLNKDGTVKLHQKISDTEGGFEGQLDNGDQFGHTMADIGDLDGDGVLDLAVDAIFDDDGGMLYSMMMEDLTEGQHTYFS